MSGSAKLKIVHVEAPVMGRVQFRTKPVMDEHGWRAAIEDFLLDAKSRLEATTVAFYRQRLSLAGEWMIAEGRDGAGVPIREFKVRDLREYLAMRVDVLNVHTGKPIKASTCRHDAIAMKAFARFCAKEGHMPAFPLADYKLPKADRPHIASPPESDITRLLKASTDRWLPHLNPGARYHAANGRKFFARRQFAVICCGVDTALRIGEILALTINDYDPSRRQLAVQEAKSNTGRTVPISDALAEAIDAWLRVRPKCSSDLLFISEYGGPIDYWVIRKSLKRDCEFAGITPLSFHKLRHYALTEIAKTDIWAAQQIAGHSSANVTRVYLHGDADHVRGAHTTAAPLSKLMVNKRSEQQKRKKLI
jgi:integrase